MRILLETKETPPKLVGCEHYLCHECVWNNRDRQKCDGKREYDELLKEGRLK